MSDVRLAGCRDSSPSLLINEVFCQTTGSGLELMIFTNSTAVRKANNVKLSTYLLPFDNELPSGIIRHRPGDTPARLETASTAGKSATR